MAKYNYIKLGVKKAGDLEGLEKLSQTQLNGLRYGNAIYIYRGSKSKKVYIGQTKHFLTRNQEHFDGTEEKFNIAKFDSVVILFSEYFNGSALDDVENQLITYFVSDNSKSHRQTVEFNNDEIINRTGGNSVNEYKDRERVASEVILPFWEKVLYHELKWVKTPTLNELRTRELVKYSPIKSLTNQQSNLIDEIITSPDKSFVINGDAGTGKTVLLTHLVARLINERPHMSVAVIVQPNWLKTAKNIFKVYGMNSTSITVATSIQLIESKNTFDTIIVDESHKLSRRHNKQHNRFNSVYKGAYSKCQSHLEIIKKLGHQIVLMYDVLQAIRPANVTREQFSELTKDFEKRYLTTQFRIQAPAGKSYTSDDYINGIKYLLYKDTGLLKYTNFDPNFDRDVFKDSSSDAYFGYFTDKPLHNLVDWVDTDRNFNPEHINRVLAGLVEPWKQSDGKDKSKTHWHEGDLNRRWNSTQENWVNSNDNDAEDQIGSVFAVQGIDLNKVGVLIGNDIQVGKDGKLYGNPDNFYNVNGKFSKEEQEIPKNKKEFTIFVLNIYYVLLTRGIDGVRLGFWKNDEFRKYMEKTLDIN